MIIYYFPSISISIIHYFKYLLIIIYYSRGLSIYHNQGLCIIIYYCDCQCLFIIIYIYQRHSSHNLHNYVKGISIILLEVIEKLIGSPITNIFNHFFIRLCQIYFIYIFIKYIISVISSHGLVFSAIFPLCYQDHSWSSTVATHHKPVR